MSNPFIGVAESPILWVLADGVWLLAVWASIHVHAMRLSNGINFIVMNIY